MTTPVTDRVRAALADLAPGASVVIPDMEWLDVDDERSAAGLAPVTLSDFIDQHRQLRSLGISLQRAPAADAWIARRSA